MKSVLLSEYEQLQFLPTLNELLDFRNKLKTLMNRNEYPICWYYRELKATDILLKKLCA